MNNCMCAFTMAQSNLLANFYESLLLPCLECRIWNPWRKRNPNLEEFGYEMLGPVRGFKKVYHGILRGGNRRIVAIKEIAISDDSEAVRRQIYYLKYRFKHGNVVRLLDTLIRGNRLYLVYEYFTPDLCYLISQPVNREDPQRRRFLHQILSAVAYYHSHGILHRDLKPQNFLLDFFADSLKLADYDWACASGDPDAYYTMETSQYSAPELLLGSRFYSKAADVWSVGCIFGEMVTGQALFHGKRQKDQLEKIFRLLGTPTEESWPGVNALCNSLSSFPKFEPMDLAVKFPGLLPEGLDLLSQMLCLDPSKRISATEALNHAYFQISISDPFTGLETGGITEIRSQQVQSSTD